jgi:PAS domain S-box-containing protein
MKFNHVSTFPGKGQGKSTVLAVARDITERKQAEQALQRAEQLN